ncbi:hypothetical protein SAMN05660337_1255 [Maridesulfovibrio ferrireducens]|uniref:Uncharacterized protein n=1 Tax=Maridesulfovibrio ferrireducens TaxID=246191 RepID=A0A1G9ETF9_9BACT|nr:hypothetical protein [Maridesulfovibrio ferrireducens]SDK79285.1 hypothetical protein SAMN05660337_1255 [Maridesulfovibrio ferrireducens]
MSTTQALTGPLIKSGSYVESRGPEHIITMFKEYDIKRYAVYVDHTTVPQHIPSRIGKYELAGFYTFDINLAGACILDSTIQLLRTDAPMPDCDGWLVASTSRASAFSLAHALLETNNSHQIIIRYYSGQTSEISAYMDFISDEAETVININHYFNRKFRIVFPVDLRWKVCACDGTIVRSGQVIIPPGGCISLKSAEMNLSNFRGYLKVECEIENLQSRVQPFIHFWADYISPAGMCRNHQSGWSQWPPHTVFNRGIVPSNPDLEAYTCIYNENDCPVTVRALLHFHKDGQDISVEKSLVPILAGHMSYQNLNELFSDLPLDKTSGAYVLLSCDKPLHRPNHYLVQKGTFIPVDTYHQTGGSARFWSNSTKVLDKQEIKIRNSANMRLWEVVFPLLDKRFEIETWIGLLSPTTCELTKVLFRVLDENGNEIFSKPEKIGPSSPQFTNLNEYMSKHGVDLSGKGNLCITPDPESARISPSSPPFTFALKHKNFPYLCTTFISSGPDVNIPFYVNASLPKSREYSYSPMQVSDHFGPGTLDDEYDSLYIVRHHSLNKSYNTTAEYHVEIYDKDGRMYVVHREVGPNTHDTFLLSELLEETPIKGKYGDYTIWFKSYNQLLKPYIALFRKSDKAISLDDGSEGTLQTEPQIAQIDPHELLSYLQDLGLVKKG